MPGSRPEAKMLKFRIDRQVTVFLNLLLKFVKRFTVGQAIKFIVRAYEIFRRGFIRFSLKGYYF